MGKKFLLSSSFLFFGLATSAVWGKFATVTIYTDTATTNLLTAAMTTKEQIEAQAEAKLNDIFKINDISGFTSGVAQSQINANKGLGVDYGSKISYFIVGVGFGLGVNTGSQQYYNVNYEKIYNEVKNYNFPSVGFNPSFNAMVGFNLGAFTSKNKDDSAKDFILYFNFFSITRKISSVTLAMTNVGVHAQRNLISERSVGLGSLLWGGIRLTSGFDYLSNSIVFNDGVSFSQNGGTAPATYTLDFKPTGTISLDSRTVLIPVEVSTYLRLFYFLSTYIGTGIDFAVSSKTEFKALADTNINLSLAGGQAGVIGNANLNISENKGAETVNPRFFAGLQFNIAAFKIVIHGNSSYDLKNLGASLGLRFGW